MSGTTVPVDDLQTFLGSQPDVERLFDNVQAIVPAVGLNLIKMAAWNAVEEFSLRSLYFRSKVNWQMGPGVNAVDFNPYDADMSACWVLWQTGLYSWRVTPPAQLIDLTEPIPTTTRTGQVMLALKPVSFDVELPPELWTNWFEVILDGTLFRLYGQPAKPWSAPTLAQYHGTRFRQGMNRARDVANRNFSNQPPAWRFPMFATGRRKQ